MAEQTIKTRLQLKTDTTENWEKADGFIPKKGEPVVYQDGASSFLKIGDGSTNVNALEFVEGKPQVAARITIWEDGD